MSWERQKVTITVEPEEPSTMLWLMACLVAVITGVLLFVLHANQFLGALQKFNSWIVAGSPLFVWFGMMCLRSWLYNHAMDRHQFESDEAEYAQQQWTNWAGRYLAVLYSRVILPAELIPARFMQSPSDLEQSNALVRRIVLPPGEDMFSVLLGGLDESAIHTFDDLPFGVTLLTDASEPEEHLQKVFSAAWIQHVGPAFSVPSLTILNTRSFRSVEERIKTPTMDVELWLIHQTQGGDVYSDGLAALLLTSDDVATKYRLRHHARLLRPMSIGPTEDLSQSFDTFLSTQSQAIRTNLLLGDNITWGKIFSTLLSSAKKFEIHWTPQQCYWLEEYAGRCGPFSPWIMAAVVSDIVALTKEDCLMLSDDKEQLYMNTATTGDLANDKG